MSNLFALIFVGMYLLIGFIIFYLGFTQKENREYLQILYRQAVNLNKIMDFKFYCLLMGLTFIIIWLPAWLVGDSED